MTALVTFAVVVAFAFGMAGDMRVVGEVARVWERYARERGYRFRGAGALRSSHALRVVARLGEEEIVLDVRGSGKAYRTRVSARLVAHFPGMDEQLALALHMLRTRREVRLICDGGLVELSWAGVEEDSAILDAAIAAVASACTWRSAGGVYR